ncbi:hypothetical protein BDV19DRAFT_384462 [Aspergillus venezuelensis]
MNAIDVDPDKLVSISVSIGAAPNAGGSIPHLAVFDEYGGRIGQYKGDANGHIDDEETKIFTINPTQNGGKQATPDYLLMVMQESDETWPCQNTRRMTFHPETVPDSLVARFDPSSEYNSQGGMESLNHGIDPKTWHIPDETFKKKRANESLPRNDEHSARELCDHPMSLGPDFVDIPEGLFCDMGTGKVWPLCEDPLNETPFDLDSREMRYSFNATMGAANSVSRA